MSFLASSLSGSWTGGTKTTRKGRYSTHVTESVWENTRLEFEITEEQKDVIVIKGNGETVWKSRRIPFMIEGVGLIASPTRVDISITKRHKGMKREIEYELILNPMSRTIEGGDSKTTVRLAHVSSSLLKDLSSHEWNGFSYVCSVRECSSYLSLPRIFISFSQVYHSNHKSVTPCITHLFFALENQRSNTNSRL